jgi:hypothetical protein
VVGGYKAMRSLLLETTQQAVEQCDFVLLGGLTGTGKTDVLHQLDNVLDLEGHANHRGSSFGKRATAQPAQIDFENALAIDVLKKRARGIGSSCWKMRPHRWQLHGATGALPRHAALPAGVAGGQLRQPRGAHPARLRGQPVCRVRYRAR